MTRAAVLAIALATVACGSEATTSGTGGSGGSNPTSNTGGNDTGGSSTTGSGGDLFGNGGAAPTCTQNDETASITFDGVMALHAMVESLQIAPSTTLNLCWQMPEDDVELVLCSRSIAIGFDDLVYDAPVDATAFGTGAIGETYTSLPGFTVTFDEPDGPSLSGSFQGTLDDGATTHPIAGTFTGCPVATE